LHLSDAPSDGSDQTLSKSNPPALQGHSRVTTRPTPQPLGGSALSVPGLADVSDHPAFDWNHRKGTYGSGNEKEKIDYILMSQPLFSKTVGGGVFRKGVFRGKRTKDPWDMFPTLESKEQEASDHAAIYADLTDF
jgi:hypothetical protein